MIQKGERNMELKRAALIETDMAGSVPARSGTGEAAKYYPILFQIGEQDERVTYYLEDLRAWADGDVSSIDGMEHQVIMGLAQAVLNYTERAEAASPPPEGMKRIERGEDDEA